MNNNRNFNRAVCAAVHKIRPGETLYSVARRYNTDLQRLMILNGIKDPHNIAIGQEIYIPHAGNTNGNAAVHPGAPSPGRPQRPIKRTHTIATGDTLYGISRNYGVSLASLMSCNPGIDPYDLQVGAKLNIPETKAPGVMHPAAPMPRSSDSADDATNLSQTGISSDPDTTVQADRSATITDTTPITLNESDETEIRSSASSHASPVNDNIQPHASHYNSTSPDQTDIHSSEPDQNISSHTINADCIIHTVSKDETLTDILTRYGICYHALLHENPGTDFTSNMTGLSICIPYNDIFARYPENQPYIVKSGDTLLTISETTGTPSDDLLRMNPCCNILHFSTPGTRIRV